MKNENTLINNTKNGIKDGDKKFKRIKDKDDKFDMGNASSATECTGILQRAIMTDDEQENLKAVYDYGQPDTE